MISKTLILLTALVVFISSALGDVSFDLKQWTQEGPAGNGSWVTADTNGDGIDDQVTQTTNGNITFFVSPNQMGPGNEFQGSFSANSGDNDYIGFVFGFKDSSNYYVLEWKQGDQDDSWGFGAAGISILKVTNLDPAPDSSCATLWQAVDGPNTKLLASWISSNGGSGYEDGVIYNFHLTILPASIQVKITKSEDGSTVYDSGQAAVNEAVNGRVGFYNLSEENVVYSGFTYKELPTPTNTPTPTIAKPTLPPGGNMIYKYDFEGNDQSGWSFNSITVSPNGTRKFLGEFDSQTVSLTLDNLPSHQSVTISFDLLILKSWDGMGNDGPDIWDLTIDGQKTLLHTTFDNITTDPGKVQNYPDTYPGPSHPARTGATEQDTLGYTFYGDAIYHLEYTFSHAGASLQAAFTGINLQGISDESWGLDNVLVQLSKQTVDPNEPAPTPTPTPKPIDYSAQISKVSVTTAPAGTLVDIAGQAFWLNNSQPAPNVPVAVKVMVQGTSRLLNTISDNAGKFKVVFTPLLNEAGKYTAIANHPEVIAIDDIKQAEFILVGLQITPNELVTELAPTKSIEAKFTLRNMGDTPLKGITAQAADLPANIVAEVKAPTELAELKSGEVTLTLRAMDDSIRQASGKIQFKSAEGAVAVLSLPLTVTPGKPVLTAEPGTLQNGMLRGKQTLVECVITNTGGALAKSIEVLVPQASWITLVTPTHIGDLAPGEKSKIVLSLTPSASMKLGLYKSAIVVYGEGTELNIPFQFNAISEAVGDLRVLAEDEFTYYSPGAPRIEGATVTVKNEMNEVVKEVATDASGAALITGLKEGNYYLGVWAEKHNSFNTAIKIEPGMVNEVQAFLQKQVVTYRWSVVPTFIEDHYKITIESVFETHVPAPVVTIEPLGLNLAELKEDVTQINYTFANHGLIAAKDVNFFVGTHPLFEITALANHFDEIPANGVVTIPVTFRKINPAAGKTTHPLATASNPCIRVESGVHYKYKCGPDWKEHIVGTETYYYNVDICKAPPSVGGGGDGPSGNGGLGEIISQRNPVAPAVVEQTFNIDIPCIPPCPWAMGKGVYKCVEGTILDLLGVADKYKCIYTTYKAVRSTYESCTGKPAAVCIKDLYMGGMKVTKDCGKAVGKTFLQPVSTAIKIISCVNDLIFAYKDNCRKSSSKINSDLLGVSPSALDDIALASGMAALQEQVDSLKTYLELIKNFFGDPKWLEFKEEEGEIFEAWLDAFNSATLDGSDRGSEVSAAEREQLLKTLYPSHLVAADINAFIDRWNRSLEYWNANIFEEADVPAGKNKNFIIKSQLEAVWNALNNAIDANMAKGYEGLFSGTVSCFQQVKNILSGTSSTPVNEPEEEGVCARVRIRIDQEAVMTRSAFKAILEIDNNGTSALQGVSVKIKIRDDQNIAANDRFGIKAPALTGISDVSGQGMIRPSATVRAEWILIPASDAAPDGPVKYYVGGELSYIMDGKEMTVPLFPDGITVMPDPRLVAKYFHQKNIYSDDPFTTEIEPAEPFTLGLFMVNNGKGIARNVQITSAQPQIIDNEKGLEIEFKIIGTQVGTQEIAPSLAVDLGNIDPGKTAVARWLLTSTLQGKFIDYKASFKHLDGLNNPKLSLIDHVEIHELIHPIRVDVPADDNLPDYLVNDVTDNLSLPDTIHSSDGNILPVQSLLKAEVTGTPRQDKPEFKVTAAMPAGWVYLRIDDPAIGKYTLSEVKRSDGKTIRVDDNAWLTHRIKRLVGQPATEENFFHLVDFNDTAKTVAYTLVYDVKSTVTATPTPLLQRTPAATPAYDQSTPLPITTPTMTPSGPEYTPTTTPSGPGFTPTPTSTPGIAKPLEPAFIFEFNKSTVEDNGWSSSMLGGFSGNPPGFVKPISMPDTLIPKSKDHKGLMVVVSPATGAGKLDQVCFIPCNTVIETHGLPVLIQVTLQSESANSNASIYAGALKGDFTKGGVDGSISYVAPRNSTNYVESKRITCLYQPDGNVEMITPFIQIAALKDGGTATVYIDKVEIYLLYKDGIVPGSLLSSN